jgi:hypothetical protein
MKKNSFFRTVVLADILGILSTHVDYFRVARKPPGTAASAIPD